MATDVQLDNDTATTTASSSSTSIQSNIGMQTIFRHLIDVISACDEAQVCQIIETFFKNVYTFQFLLGRCCIANVGVVSFVNTRSQRCRVN